MVAPARIVLSHYALESVAAKETSSPQRGQRGFGFGLEPSGEPFGKRREEALLGTMDDFGWQELLRQLLEEILSGAAALLERRVKPCAKLEEAVIEVRNARLERIRHGGAVDFGQEVVRQP